MAALRKSQVSLSPYGKAKRFILGYFALCFAVPLGLFVTGFFVRGDDLPPPIVFGAYGAMFIFALVGLVATRCPRCGTSLFSSGEGLISTYRPWPSETCGRCKLDLTRRGREGPLA